MTRFGLSGGVLRVYRATLVIAGVTAFSRGLTALREILIARDFGTSGDVDAIIVAGAVPAAVAGVTLAAVSAAIVPRLVAAERQGGVEAADSLADGIGRVLGIAAALVSAAVFAGAPLVVSAFGVTGPSRSIAVVALRIIAPSIGFTTLTALWSSVLLSRHRNLASVGGLIATPILSVAAVLLLASRRGIIVLAWAILVGSVVEWLVARGLARRGRSVPSTVLAESVRRGSTDPARRAALAVIPPFTAIGLVSMSIISDQLFAARLGTGSVATLAFGSRLVTLLIVLTATSLGLAALPHYSKLVEAGQWDDLRAMIRSQRVVILVASAAIIAVVVVGSDPIISTVFGRGRFTGSDVSQAAAVQRFAVLQLPWYAMWFLTSRLASALGRTRIQIVVSVLGLVTNVTMDWLLSSWLGLRGIALASTPFQLVLCIGTGLIVRRELDRRCNSTADDVTPAAADAALLSGTSS